MDEAARCESEISVRWKGLEKRLRLDVGVDMANNFVQNFLRKG
jgi:hypothetical protein